MKINKTIISSFIVSLMSSPLWAMAARPAVEGAPQPPWYVTMAPVVVMVAVFYFLMIRPQSKLRREKQALLNDLKPGDKIITQGGLYGTVATVQPQTLEIKLNEETRVKIQRSAVTEIVKDETPVSLVGSK